MCDRRASAPSFRGVVRVEARGARGSSCLTDLESEHEFATNRTGLVVLHPPQLAGEALRVTHADGSAEESSFPAAISPHQPVLDIAELAWLHDGIEVAVAFEGDVFEMEDQRNWSDASYKTYSRPLELPFPYAIAAGERVRQSVYIDVRDVARIHCDDRLRPASVCGWAARSFEVASRRRHGAGPGARPPPVARPAAVLVELDLRTPNWRAALARARGLRTRRWMSA